MDENARFSFLFFSYVYILNRVSQFNEGEIYSLVLPTSHISSLPHLAQTECFDSPEQQVYVCILLSSCCLHCSWKSRTSYALLHATDL